MDKDEEFEERRAAAAEVAARLRSRGTPTENNATEFRPTCSNRTELPGGAGPQAAGGRGTGAGRRKLHRD